MASDTSITGEVPVALRRIVTGHDTVYRWHCSGGKAVTKGIVETVDARGFLSRNWKDAGKQPD